jgi:tRNA A37 threonylcarbamoyltransferase TsaD
MTAIAQILRHQTLRHVWHVEGHVAAARAATGADVCIPAVLLSGGSLIL